MSFERIIHGASYSNLIEKKGILCYTLSPDDIMDNALNKLLPKILEFIENAEMPFTIGTLADFLHKKKSQHFLNFLIDSLMHCGLVFIRTEAKQKKENTLCVPKKIFFKDKIFPVSISDMELSKGIFIPAARLLPFLPEGMFPHDVTILYKGKKIPKIEIDMQFEAIKTFYFLYAENIILQNILENNTKSVELFISSDEKNFSDIVFPFSVFNFSEIYTVDTIANPFHLLIRIVDWENTVFEILDEPCPVPSQKESENWFKNFEKALTESFIALDFHSETEEFLSYAYFYAEKKLFTLPAEPLEHYFKQHSVFGIVDYGLEQKFWFTQIPFPYQDTWFEAPSICYDEIEEFFYDDLKIPITESVLYLFTTQFISEHYIERADKITEDIFIKKTVGFIFPPERAVYSETYEDDKEQCEYVLAACYKCYVDIYNPFKNSELKKIRQFWAEIYKDILLFLNSLYEKGITPDVFDEHIPITFSQICSKLTMAAQFLAEAEKKGTDPLIHTLYMSLIHIADIYDKIKEDIIHHLNDIHKK